MTDLGNTIWCSKRTTLGMIMLEHTERRVIIKAYQEVAAAVLDAGTITNHVQFLDTMSSMIVKTFAIAKGRKIGTKIGTGEGNSY